MADLSALTERQREIYDFIRDKIEDFGFPPTIRDIGTAFEIRSPNGVMCHLKALEKKGYITRQGKSARAIQLMHRPAGSGSVPFKGLVAAGSPLASWRLPISGSLWVFVCGRRRRFPSPPARCSTPSGSSGISS